MNRAIFDSSVETQLAPALSHGGVVILDNLSSHSERTGRKSNGKPGRVVPLPAAGGRIAPIKPPAAKTGISRPQDEVMRGRPGVYRKDVTLTV
jgi:hypothetical protein